MNVNGFEYNGFEDVPTSDGSSFSKKRKIDEITSLGTPNSTFMSKFNPQAFNTEGYHPSQEAGRILPPLTFLLHKDNENCVEPQNSLGVKDSTQLSGIPTVIKTEDTNNNFFNNMLNSNNNRKRKFGDFADFSPSALENKQSFQTSAAFQTQQTILPNINGIQGNISSNAIPKSSQSTMLDREILSRFLSSQTSENHTNLPPINQLLNNNVNPFGADVLNTNGNTPDLERLTPHQKLIRSLFPEKESSPVAAPSPFVPLHLQRSTKNSNLAEDPQQSFALVFPQKMQQINSTNQTIDINENVSNTTSPGKSSFLSQNQLLYRKDSSLNSTVQTNLKEKELELQMQRMKQIILEQQRQLNEKTFYLQQQQHLQNNSVMPNQNNYAQAFPQDMNFFNENNRMQQQINYSSMQELQQQQFFSTQADLMMSPNVVDLTQPMNGMPTSGSMGFASQMDDMSNAGIMPVQMQTIQTIQALPEEEEQLYKVRELATTFGFSKDSTKHWRFRDLKRSLLDKMPKDQRDYIENHPQHSLILQRLPHKLSKKQFCKRVVLLVFNFIVRDGGKEPKFWAQKPQEQKELVEEQAKKCFSDNPDEYFLYSTEFAKEVALVRGDANSKALTMNEVIQRAFENLNGTQQLQQQGQMNLPQNAPQTNQQQLQQIQNQNMNQVEQRFEPQTQQFETQQYR